MKPPKVQLKAWGSNYDLGTIFGVSVAIATIKAGGKSSIHCHPKRVNRFVVLSGLLGLELVGTHDVKYRQLMKDDWADVPPGTWHRFHAVSDCVLAEVYWPDLDKVPSCPEDDIVRSDR